MSTTSPASSKLSSSACGSHNQIRRLSFRRARIISRFVSKVGGVFEEVGKSAAAQATASATQNAVSRWLGGWQGLGTRVWSQYGSWHSACCPDRPHSSRSPKAGTKPDPGFHVLPIRSTSWFQMNVGHKDMAFVARLPDTYWIRLRSTYR
jgi:hypothetical protein